MSVDNTSLVVEIVSVFCKPRLDKNTKRGDPELAMMCVTTPLLISCVQNPQATTLKLLQYGAAKPVHNANMHPKKKKKKKKKNRSE